MLAAVLIGIATVTGVVYFILLRSASYWRRRGLPYVEAPLLWGCTHELFQRDRPRMLIYPEWTKIYGKTYGIKEGALNTLITSDLEMIHEILVKQFDNFYARKNLSPASDPEKSEYQTVLTASGMTWKRLRAVSTPSFSVASLRKIRPIIEHSALEMLGVMQKTHGDGSEFNIHEFYMEYSMDIIGRLVLGQSKSSYFDNPRVYHAKKILLADMDRPIFHLAHAFPFIRSFLKAEPFAVIRDEVTAVLEKRIIERESGNCCESQDFLDILLDYAVQSVERNNNPFKRQLNIAEVVGQAVVFLVAGFDTTANSLAFISWMLACHPDVQRQCVEEVDEFCTEESIAFDDLSNLPYLEATIRETLRFFPMATMANSRKCMQDTDVCGVKIEAGTSIQIDTMSLHFDRDIWGEDVEEFRPERWLDPERRVPSSAYLAFGGGPRLCIGMKLAILEEKMALAHLLRRFNVVKAREDYTLRVHGTNAISPISVPVKLYLRK